MANIGKLWSQSLNSHLTSLRKERKTERATRKRARENIGVAKNARPRGRETSLKNNLTSLKKHLTNEETARKKDRGGRGGFGGLFSVCSAASYPYARQLCGLLIMSETGKS